MNNVKGLPPIGSEDPEIIILGTFPGEDSLKTKQYYASPNNMFWRIINKLFNANKGFCSYNEKIAVLCHNRIVLWDVIESKARTGESSDIGITQATYNDLNDYLAAHPNIKKIVFNGKSSEHYLYSLIKNRIPFENVVYCTSTSGRRAKGSDKAIIEEWRHALMDQHLDIP